MKRSLVLMFTVLFLMVGTAGATDFTIGGSYYARGTWVDNWNGKGIDSANSKNQYGVYDHEMSLNATWQISPVTKVFARFEIRDEDWAVSTNPTEASYAGSEPDDNIIVEHVWGQHTFADSKTTIRAGLMKTSAWSTDFANEGTEAYRVLLVKDTPLGRLYAYTEKAQPITINLPAMAGGPVTIAPETIELDADNDSYALGFATKMSGVTLLPLFKYYDYESQDLQLIAVGSGAMGTFDNIGFEAEFIYTDYNYDLATKDYSAWGAYANVWVQLNALKLGALIAHGSYDEDVHQGFAFGDDFDGGGAMLLGDEVLMQDNGLNFAPMQLAAGQVSYNDLQAATLLAAYVSYAVTEKLTLGAYVGYADSNVDDPSNSGNQGKWDGASAWEVNVTGEYKITDNVTYSVGAATAQIEYGDLGGADPDKAVEIFHKLGFNF